MRSAATALLGFAALGCATAPPAHRAPELGVVLPERWTAAADPAAPAEPVVARWWTTFGDPRLVELVEEAMRHNHDLRAVAARLEVAAAQATIAGAPRLPTLDLQLDGARQRQNFIGLPLPGAGSGVLSRTFSQYGLRLATGWEVDLWGRVRAGHRAAIADVQAATADFAAAQLSLAAQTAKAYIAVVEARLQQELAADNSRLFSATAELVADRFARGIRPALDLRLARNSVAASDALIRVREQQLDGARRQLELLLGRYPAATIAAVAALPPVPPTAPAGLPAALLRRRPDVVSAERRLAAASARLDQARAALFPRLSLTAGAGTASSELEDVLDSDFFVWNLAGNLAQPLFEGGRLRAEVARGDALATEAGARYADAALRAYGEVERALAAEQLLRRRVEHLATAEVEARAALQLAEDRYRRGVTDILTVLESQRRAVNASSQRLEAQRLILDTRVDLHLALGGGFDGEEAAGPAEETP